MVGPGMARALAEFKAEGAWLHGLDDPGPNADLRQGTGITIPRPPVKYVVSSVGENLPSAVAFNSNVRDAAAHDD
eukprot:6237566-Pyramimonas_sp.AAC.1